MNTLWFAREVLWGGGGCKFSSLASGSCLPVKHPHMLTCLFSVVHITSVSCHYPFFGLSVGTMMEETSAKHNARFVQLNTITVRPDVIVGVLSIGFLIVYFILRKRGVLELRFREFLLAEN